MDQRPKTYEEGVLEGRIKGVEETVQRHDGRLESHDTRITSQERITYALLGAIALLEFLPALRDIIGN